MWHFMGKKARGVWGERLVDGYMESVGWRCVARNWRIPGGEIDRIFERNGTISERAKMVRHLCLVEVKLVTLPTVKRLEECLSEIFLSKLVKARQLRNLQKVGCHTAALCGAEQSRVALHARLFVAFRFLVQDGDSIKIEERRLPGKLCLQTPGHLLISLQPEFIANGSRSSRLQIVGIS